MIAYKKQSKAIPPSRVRPLAWWLSAVVFSLTLGLLGLRNTLKPVPASHQTVQAPPAAATGLAGAKAEDWLKFAPAYPPSNPSTPADDPAAASLKRWWQRLQSETDSQAREQLMADFLSQLHPADIPGLLGLLQKMEPADLARDLSRRLIWHWAESDLAGVTAWAGALPAGEPREAGLNNVASLWANRDLTNAMSWAGSLADETERNRALVIVANEAVRTEPVMALQLAVNLPADAERDQLIGRAAADWAARDASQAVAWAEQIPDATLRQKVLASEATAWADQDPQSAAILAVNALPAGRLQDDTVISIVERWAQQQPEAAAAWVKDFPAGPLRNTAIENLNAQWSQTDAPAARQWLATHL